MSNVTLKHEYIDEYDRHQNPIKKWNILYCIKAAFFSFKSKLYFFIIIILIH